MTLEEAKRIVSTIDAYIGSGYSEDTITIDGCLTRDELQALWLVFEAQGVALLGDEK